jgi:probable O-glycosylation ligase (exosortase A-associated)
MPRGPEPFSTRARPLGALNPAAPAARAPASPSTLGLWLVSLAVLMEYARPQDYFHFLRPLHLSLVVDVSAAAYWLLRAEKSALRDRIVRLYLAFIGLTVASVFYAVNSYLAFETSRTLLVDMVAVILPLVAFARDPQSLGRFFRVWVAVHVLLVLTSISTGGRGSGSFLTDENDLALALSIALPYAYFLAQSPRNSKLGRLLLLGAAVVIVAGVVHTYSRGGFLGLGTAVIAIVALARNRIRNLILLAVLGVGIVMAIPASYWNEISTIENKTDSTRLERLHLWHMGWLMYLDHPVIGVGSGNYNVRVYEYEIRTSNVDPDTYHHTHWGFACHSLYFTLLSETGTVGTVLFTVMCLMVILRLVPLARMLENARPRDPPAIEMALLGKAMVASLFSFLACGAFISVLYYPHFWFLMGFVITLDRVARKWLAEAPPVPERAPRP